MNTPRSLRGLAMAVATVALLAVLPLAAQAQDAPPEDKRADPPRYQRPVPGRPEPGNIQRPVPFEPPAGRPEPGPSTRPMPVQPSGGRPEPFQPSAGRPEPGPGNRPQPFQPSAGRPEPGNVYQRPVPGRPEPQAFRPEPPRPSPGYNYNTRPTRPPDRVTRLPPGYRPYYWGGSPYYQYGGYWYRPYGSSFILSSPPYGLYVQTLPPFYSTVFIGGTRYYFADDTYYSYDTGRRGYVVVQPPSGDRVLSTAQQQQPAAPAQRDQELYVYPQKGQSEQQQADDRYECHRWAVGQTQYDPIDANYNPDKRAQYDRALTACLTGKGYSVK